MAYRGARFATLSLALVAAACEKPPDVPPPTPEEIQHQIVGQTFTYDYHRLEGYWRWTIKDDEIKQLNITSRQTHKVDGVWQHVVGLSLTIRPEKPFWRRGWTFRSLSEMSGVVILRYDLRGDAWVLDQVAPVGNFDIVE